MKITQKQIAFYLLWKSRQDDKHAYVPTWKFVGEIEIPELHVHVMMSYKCPTRLTDIFQENPNLLERKQVKGKSGTTYYSYRFPSQINTCMIEDKKLKVFFNKIRTGQAHNELIKNHEQNN